MNFRTRFQKQRGKIEQANTKMGDWESFWKTKSPAMSRSPDKPAPINAQRTESSSWIFLSSRRSSFATSLWNLTTNGNLKNTQ